MKKLTIIAIGLASVCTMLPVSSFASSVNCITIKDRAICNFSFGDSDTSKKNDILYFQCVVTPLAGYNEGYEDIRVDMFNTNVKSAGFKPGGKLDGLDGFMVNRLAIANKWQRNARPQTVTIKVVQGHVDLRCKSANEPTRPVYGHPEDDNDYN